MEFRSLCAQTLAQVALGEIRFLIETRWFALILKVTSAGLVPAGHSSNLRWLKVRVRCSLIL